MAWSSGDDNVRESIRIILMTDKNERMMLPEFGAGLGRFLFASNTLGTYRLIEEAIVQSLSRWEERIAVQGVDVEAHPTQPDIAVATVRYRFLSRSTNDELSIEVPLSR